MEEEEEIDSDESSVPTPMRYGYQSEESTPLLQILPMGLSQETFSHLISNRSLFLYRFGCSALISFYLGWRITKVGMVFFWWFTSWNAILCALYFYSALIISYGNATRRHLNFHKYLCCATASISPFVSVIFWLFLVRQIPKELWETELLDLIIAHSFNSILPIADLIICKTYFGFQHILAPNVILWLYQATLLAVHASNFHSGGNVWPYPFIGDLNGPGPIKWGVMGFLGLGFSLIVTLFSILMVCLIRYRNFKQAPYIRLT